MKYLLPLILVATPVFADGTMGGKAIDCYCTDKAGERLEIGEMTCLRVDGRSFMAQCQMSLNVPMWREISEGCLSSSLPKQSQPAVQSLSINAQI